MAASTSSGKSIAEGKPLRRAPLLAVILLLSAALGITALEFGLRAIGYMPLVSHGWHLDEPQWRIPDDRTILAQADTLGDDFYEGAVDGETIVALGDSFTAGFRVAKDWRYPEILRRLLHRTGHSGNVMNFGMGDTGPDQHLRLLKEHILPQVTPAAVVWTFYPNDLEDNIRQATYTIENRSLVPLDGRQHWLFVRKSLFDAIPLPASFKASSPLLRLAFWTMEATSVWGSVDHELPERIDWAAAKVHLAIAEMERLSAEHGFEVYYVLIAPQSTYLPDPERLPSPSTIRPYRILHEILRDVDGFVSADFGTIHARPTSPEARRLEPPTGSDGIFASGERDPARLGDRHFNEVGFLLLAEVVARNLLASSDMPAWLSAYSSAPLTANIVR